MVDGEWTMLHGARWLVVGVMHVTYVVVSLGKRELAADTDVRMDTARGWLVSEMQFFSVLCRHSSVQMNYFSCVWTLTTTDD